jgi:hypothetical protein
MARRESINVGMDPRAHAQLEAVRTSLTLLDKGLKKKFEGVVRSEFIDPLAAAARTHAVADGGQSVAVAKVLRSTAGAKLVLGGARVKWWSGATFGGQSDEKRPQTMTWRRRDGSTKRGLIYRRSSMQFRPHKGKTGYLLFPVWRQKDRELTERLVKALDRFLAEEVG